MNEREKQRCQGILAWLKHNPGSTSESIAKAVGCSRVEVWESLGWMIGQGWLDAKQNALYSLTEVGCNWAAMPEFVDAAEPESEDAEPESEDQAHFKEEGAMKMMEKEATARAARTDKEQLALLDSQAELDHYGATCEGGGIPPRWYFVAALNRAVELSGGADDAPASALRYKADRLMADVDPRGADARADLMRLHIREMGWEIYQAYGLAGMSEIAYDVSDTDTVAEAWRGIGDWR